MRFGLGEIWSRDTGGLGQEHVSWFAQPVRQLAGLHCCSPLAGVGVGRQAPGLLASDRVHCTRCSTEVTSLTLAGEESRGVLPMLKPGDLIAMGGDSQESSL